MKNTEKSMDTLVNLCKNRGFVYAGSEIYGGLANTWDYGPLGVELKNNIKRAWWKKFIQENPYNVGQDAAILMNLSTYFLCYWLLSSALTTLLDRFYITKRRLRTYLSMDTVFHPFRHRSAVVTKRWFTDNGDVCLGRMVGYLWAVPDP